MKQTEKNAISRRRILDAAMEEFSAKGYDAASLSSLCLEKGISKGIIYHYFKDRDSLYLACAEDCFQRLTDYLEAALSNFSGSPMARLDACFHARLQFFVQNPSCLGLFQEAMIRPPAKLAAPLAAVKAPFDRLNLSVLEILLGSLPLRPGLSPAAALEDLHAYINFFNSRLGGVRRESLEHELREQEEKRRRQLNMLLYGLVAR